MMEAALLSSCYVLNRVALKNKENTPYEEWIGRKASLSYLRTWYSLAKVNVPIKRNVNWNPKRWSASFWDMLMIALAIDF
jgi:hypothetical protein